MIISISPLLSESIVLRKSLELSDEIELTDLSGNILFVSYNNLSMPGPYCKKEFSVLQFLHLSKKTSV